MEGKRESVYVHVCMCPHVLACTSPMGKIENEYSALDIWRGVLREEAAW